MTESQSLSSKQSFSGIHGGKGYTTQVAVLLHKLPGLLEDIEFKSCMVEGAEDFDLRFERAGQPRFRLFQIKDTRITSSNFQEIVIRFHEKHLHDPKLYERFAVVAHSFSDEIERVRLRLERHRNHHYPDTSVGAATEADIRQELQMLFPNAALCDWALAHLDIELATGLTGWPHQLDDLAHTFASKCLDCRQFAAQVVVPFRHAYFNLLAFLDGCKGQTVTREALLERIHGLCRDFGTGQPERPLVLHLHHRGQLDERARSQADRVFEWQEWYDYSTGRFPEPAQASILLTSLEDYEHTICRVWRPKTVRLEGGCSLSAAVALGHVWRATKGYVLEGEQRGELWSTSGEASTEILLRLNHERQGSVETPDAVLGLGVGRSVQTSVETALEQQGLGWPTVCIFETAAEELTAAQARKVAQEIVRQMRDLSTRHARVHLFFSGPMMLALFIGHRLNALGNIVLYEWSAAQGQYQPTFCLETNR